MNTTIRVLFHETGEFVLPDYKLFSVGPDCLERYIDVPAGIQQTERFLMYVKHGLVEVDLPAEPENEENVIPVEEAPEAAPEAVEEAIEEMAEEEEKPEKKTRRKKGDA